MSSTVYILHRLYFEYESTVNDLGCSLPLRTFAVPSLRLCAFAGKLCPFALWGSFFNYLDADLPRG